MKWFFTTATWRNATQSSFILIICFFANRAPAAVSASCSDQYFDGPSSLCSQWKNSTDVFLAEFDDGTALPNPFILQGLVDQPAVFGKYLPLLRSKNLPSASQQKKVQLAFAELRRSTKNLVVKGRVGSGSDAVKRQLLDRLSKLKLTFVQGRNSGNTFAPEAFNQTEDNLVELTLSGSNYPLETLLPILSHEIAHSMDPCTSDVFLFPISMVEELKSGQRDRMKECQIPADFADGMKATALDPKSTGGRIFNEQSSWQIPVLMSCNVIENAVNPMPTSYDGSPFKELRQCLLTEWASSKPATNTTNSKYEEQTYSISTSKNCSSISKESFADHLGAAIVAEYLKDSKTALRPDRKQHLAFYFAANYCRFGVFQGKSYPSAYKRLETILSVPSVQSTIGCQGLSTMPACVQ